MVSRYLSIYKIYPSGLFIVTDEERIVRRRRAQAAAFSDLLALERRTNKPKQSLFWFVCSWKEALFPKRSMKLQ